MDLKNEKETNLALEKIRNSAFNITKILTNPPQYFLTLNERKIL